MMRVFLYEYLSGGGSLGDDDVAAAELRPQGVAMRDALAADLLACGLCELTVATCPQSPPVHRQCRPVLPEPTEAPTAFVARQARGHDATWVIAPESGGLLAAFARVVGPERWLGADASAIRVGSSKHITLQCLAARGVRTPLDWRHEGLARRWVVKPDDGAGSVDTRVHPDHASALADHQARLKRDESSWMEPWVEGEAWSLSLWCGHGEAELLSVNRQHVHEAADGALHFAGVTVDHMPTGDARREAMALTARQVAAAMPGLRGYAGVDVVWHDEHGPVVIEVNPRLTSAYVGLPQRLGRSLAADMLRLWQRERVHA